MSIKRYQEYVERKDDEFGETLGYVEWLRDTLGRAEKQLEAERARASSAASALETTSAKLSAVQATVSQYINTVPVPEPKQMRRFEAIASVLADIQQDIIAALDASK